MENETSHEFRKAMNRNDYGIAASILSAIIGLRPEIIVDFLTGAKTKGTGKYSVENAINGLMTPTDPVTSKREREQKNQSMRS